MPLTQDIIDRTLSSPQGEAAYHIVEQLADAAHEAYWVGGCVRDMLLGTIPEDIDIATSALPTELMALFPKHNAEAELMGSIVIAHGGTTLEVTTFRKDDSSSDGRHPEKVTFTKSMKQDAERRDITINALYFHPISSELFDPYNGERDLNERLIRIIGDPVERVEHDALRLLRVVRFRAAINGQYHPDTYAALHKRSAMIGILSGTRRLEELEKILHGTHPEIAFEDLWETDILEYLLPELHACKGVGQPSDPHTEGDVWNHILKVISSFTNDHSADVRLAALFHDIGKPHTFSIQDDRIHFNEHASKSAEITKSVLDRLQCLAKRRDKIVWLVGHHMTMGTFLELNEQRKAHWYYHPWFVELLQLFWLDIAGTGYQDFSLYEKIINDYNAFLDAHPRPKKPLLTGEEVMEILGIPPSERVGEILKILHEQQLKNEITTKQEAKDSLASL